MLRRKKWAEPRGGPRAERTLLTAEIAKRLWIRMPVFEDGASYAGEAVEWLREKCGIEVTRAAIYSWRFRHREALPKDAALDPRTKGSAHSQHGFR